MIENGLPLQLRNPRDGCEPLVSEHYDRLYRWFLWMTNTADDAADLTHDTFMAVWESLDRFDPSAELVRGLFHGALRVYLDRFLNMPPAAFPGERGGLDDLPAKGSELLEHFLLTLDGQAQTDEAGRIVARYLALRHPAGPLIRVLVRAVVREDASFPTYQMLEATVQQHQEWGDTEQGGHILLAGARYIAAHSPTQREMLQTAEIVQRLHRGEDLHEQGGLSRY